MKKSRWSSEQIVQILSEAEQGQSSLGELCRKHGISTATFYNWRKRFRGMGVDEARRLRELERENAQLRKLLAGQVMKNDALEEVLKKKW